MRLRHKHLEWVFLAACAVLTVYYFSPGGTGLALLGNTLQQAKGHLAFLMANKRADQYKANYALTKGPMAPVKGVGFSTRIEPQKGLALLGNESGIVLPLFAKKAKPRFRLVLTMTPGARWPLGKSINVYLNGRWVAKGIADPTGVKIDRQVKMPELQQGYSVLTLARGKGPEGGAAAPGAEVSGGTPGKTSGAGLGEGLGDLVVRNTWAYFKSIQILPVNY